MYGPSSFRRGVSGDTLRDEYCDLNFSWAFFPFSAEKARERSPGRRVKKKPSRCRFAPGVFIQSNLGFPSIACQKSNRRGRRGSIDSSGEEMDVERLHVKRARRVEGGAAKVSAAEADAARSAALERARMRSEVFLK